tara:strand:- start:1833 stop:2267 length:435 start_codon:yes stop_codon:yes gene_type:complete
VFVKVFLALVFVAGISFIILAIANRDDQEQNIDDWAKQSAQLFKDTAQFFSSLPSEVSKDVEEIDEKLESLLPSDDINLRYEPNLDETIDVAQGQPVSVAPDALLPNLFDPKEKSGTSVKGQIFTDEKDKIIGAEVQLAIPTDM